MAWQGCMGWVLVTARVLLHMNGTCNVLDGRKDGEVTGADCGWGKQLCVLERSGTGNRIYTLDITNYAFMTLQLRSYHVACYNCFPT